MKRKRYPKSRLLASWKIIRLAQQRTVARFLQSAYAMSQRRPCRLAGLSRKAAGYQRLKRPDEALRIRRKELGE